VESDTAKPIAHLWTKPGMSRVERVIAFLEALPVTKGICAGQSMKLLPTQRAFIEKVYGRDENKRVRIAVKSEPRGNGKTGLVAGMALCHLLGPEAEMRGEVYSAAIDRQQAALLFTEMEAIILAVPEFAYRVNIVRFHKKIEVLQGDGKGSTYEALSADARRGHGLAPSLWIYDELAQAKDRELLDNLTTGMGKRKRSMGLVISTQAPEDDHPLSQLIDEGLANPDGTVVVDLLAAPKDANPFDIEVVRACNPAMGAFLNEQDVLADMDRAKRIPQFEASFRNLRLNQRVEPTGEGRLCTIADWKRGDVAIDLDALEGRECYGGLDLSSKQDLTALVLAFADEADGFDLVPFFWTPEGQMAKRAKGEQYRFREWIEAGYITAVPGPIIRYDYVAEKIAELASRFNIAVIAYDKWKIDDLKSDLADMELELPLEGFGQGHSKAMQPAIEFFAELALTGRMRHGGHPVLTACIANAVVVSDRAGNPMIDKPKSNKRGPVRIDGAVATVMALGTAHRFMSDSRTVEGELVCL
jgi:phage terminase large subunit-like protein